MSLYILKCGSYVRPIKLTNYKFVQEEDVMLTRDVSLKDINYYVYSNAIHSGNLFGQYAFNYSIKGYDGFLYNVDDVCVERL